MFKVTQNETNAPYTAGERLYLNAEGKVVKEDDPTKLTLLVAEGGTLNAEDVSKYGLLAQEGDSGDEQQPQKAQVKLEKPKEVDTHFGGTPPTPESKAVQGPLEDKAMKGPFDNK